MFRNVILNLTENPHAARGLPVPPNPETLAEIEVIGKGVHDTLCGWVQPWFFDNSATVHGHAEGP